MLIFETQKIFDDYRSRKLFNVSIVISQIFGVCALLSVTTWMGSYENGYAWSEDPQKQFHYHPTLMSIGPLFLLGEAILIFRLFRRESKSFSKLLHVILHSIAFLFAMVALKAVWDSHDYNRGPDGELSPIPNLYSLHSWIGIFVFASFCIQFVCGFITYFYPKLSTETRRSFLPFHQLFGVLLMIGFTAAALLGVSERAAWKHTCWTRDKELCGQQVVSNFFALFMVGYTSMIVFIIMNPRWKRMPLPEEECLQLSGCD